MRRSVSLRLSGEELDVVDLFGVVSPAEAMTDRIEPQADENVDGGRVAAAGRGEDGRWCFFNESSAKRGSDASSPVFFFG